VVGCAGVGVPWGINGVRWCRSHGCRGLVFLLTPFIIAVPALDSSMIEVVADLVAMAISVASAIVAARSPNAATILAATTARGTASSMVAT
jgi:hypothetical protein